MSNYKLLFSVVGILHPGIFRKDNNTLILWYQRARIKIEGHHLITWSIQQIHIGQKTCKISLPMFFSLVSYQPMYLLVNTTLTGKGANLCLYSALAGRSHDSHVQIHLFEWFAKMAIMIVVFKGHLNPKYLFAKIYLCVFCVWKALRPF